MARDSRRGASWDIYGKLPIAKRMMPFTHPDSKLRDLRPKAVSLPDAGFAMPRWIAYALLFSIAVLVGAIALAVGMLVSGCAAAPAPVAPKPPAANFWIPETLKDSDTLCIPVNGGALCRRVEEVRAFVASRKAEP